MVEKETILEFIISIGQKLSLIGKYAPWADDQQVVGKLQQLNMDFEFLDLFCSKCCREIWDEQSRIRLRSSITAFRVIWADGLIQKTLKDTWPVDVQAFHSLAFQLGGKIQQSKQLVQQRCEYLVRSSTQLKFTRDDFVWYTPYTLLSILNSFSTHRAAKIVPFKNQIDILKDKVVFLDRLWVYLNGVRYSEKIFRINNFTSEFTKNALCISCLYWAKEANEENATEMNILLFDMSQKFIPYTRVLSILIYENWLTSNVLLATVASFVDIFFKHLDNEFLILRDPLTLLFASLSNTTHESAEAEEDVLRGQMYAIFHEHLLSISEMKEVLSNKKMFVSDFMTHIVTANAKIRQLYYARFSNSCISLEAEKMDYIYFVSVSRELYLIETYSEWMDLVKSQLCLYKMELRFLRVFLLCFATWDNEDIRARLSSMITSLQVIWQKDEEGKGLLVTRLHAIRRGDAADWHPLALELEGKIQLSKLEMKARCVNLFDWSFQFKPSTGNKIMEFLDSILNILKNLVTYKADEIIAFKKQIETLEEKLVFLKNILKLTVNCVDSKALREFKMFVEAFANDAACLTLFYWAKDANENIASEVNPMLSHMLKKINPSMPHIARLYFQILEIIYMQQNDSLLFGQTASIFVSFFIENLTTHFEDDFQILHDEVIFLLTFLNDPPNRIAGDVICSQIDNLFPVDVYGFLPFDDMEGDFVKKKMLLSDFIIKIGAINSKIRKLYGKFLDSSLYNFPKVVSPLFLDFVIHNLRNLNERMISDRKYAPFAKYKIMKAKEELVSFRPLFNYIFDLQNEQNETWLEVINLVHLIEHIIKSCISSWFVFDHPIWYHMACLCDVISRIKVVKTKLEKIKENTMYNARCLLRSTSSTPLHQAKTSEIIEIFVGFEDEAVKIIGMLTQENMSLDIVSIVGMGGSGKTTLAKKVYGSLSVKCNFDVSAFCLVSHDHNTKRLLMDILRDIVGDDKRFHDMTKDDLAHQLWKCLSRQKYLIVLDDIWNVSAWNEIKGSFPDNKNKSRIMFTTRSYEVANKCKINCSPHRLRFLTEVESWELLERIVFHNGISPQYLLEAGRRIANNCKGLPLAVAVIAGILATTEKTRMWWNEVAENLVSYLSDEGCMNILELSYLYLPDILKPCFIYLAAFPKDMLIGVKKVILLWIAEGFVQESKSKCLEDVARDYVHDLVDRSLIIVSTRSSNGGIKEFHVHDLLHDLCQMKCRDEKFIKLNYKITSSFSDSRINNYRVSTQEQSDVTDADGSSILNSCSLLYFSKSHNDKFFGFPFKEFRLAQVLDLDLMCQESDISQLSSLVHLRHLDVGLGWNTLCVVSSICNLWNIGSLILDSRNVQLPETFWRMKNLRYVKVKNLFLKFSDGYEHEEYPKLDKVVKFSCPIFSNGKDVQRLLQRLPAVRRLGCYMNISPDYNEESIDTLDLFRKIESLTLENLYLNFRFPWTLRKLTLICFRLPWTVIKALAGLHFLEVLKLRYNCSPEREMEMEDITFQNLKFFELKNNGLVEWNASTESLPCLEQLVIECPKLKELPPCFGEMSTLKRIVINRSIENSALRIQEELMELGIIVEVSIE